MLKKFASAIFELNSKMRNLESIQELSSIIVSDFFPNRKQKTIFYRKTVKIFTDGSPLPFEAEFNK